MHVLLLLVACTGPEREPREQSPLFGVDETETWTLPGLTAPAYVLRTESDVPHLYAADDEILARIEGFEVARDRFFVMDLARRLAEGRVSSLLGDLALATDMQSRASGMTYVTDLVDTTLTDETARRVEAFADGVNAYIDAVAAGQLPPPSEYEIAAPLLGAQEPAELMEPFSRRDVAAIGATLIYNLGYETGDVGNQVAWDEIPGRFDGQALGDLRNAGLTADIWEDDAPLFPIASANGWQTETGSDQQARERARRTRPLPQSIVDRVTRRLPVIEKRLGHDHALGWGSNAWAVAGAVTTDGRALVAGDGHLPLSIPSLFYQIGLDTSVLGDGDTHQMGLVFPGMPVMAVGTNGQVGWSQTQLMGDITDWYREELQLDASGRPQASRFQGAFQPLVATDESYEVRDVPFFSSVGRTETWTRWQTFDGRWITDIEGRTATADETLASGETLVNLGGDYVVPEDTDGDGVITAISFDYTGFDKGNLIEASDHFGHAHDVREFREATKRLTAYSQNIAVADANGDILYTGWQPVPCRAYLDREQDGHWSDGSNPSMLLDGTRYGAFAIPFADGIVDETSTDPYQCVVPFDQYPQSITPDRGYILTANNDPGGHSLDGKLWNDPWYIGGPWIEGYRADTINQGLSGLAASHTADLDTMQALQASTRSRTGEQWVPMLVGAIDAAREATSADPDSARLQAIYALDPAGLDEAQSRLQAWSEHGYPTPSGVETFYHQVAEGEVDDAVATTIFNAWFGRWVSGVLDDENFPGVYKPTGSTGRMRLLKKMVLGRGPGNPLGLASWNPATGESAYFDRLGTDPVETSDEIAAQALVDALVHLRLPSTTAGVGGFGSPDMSTWIWGLRHWVHFDSILGDYVDNSQFGFIIDQFSITPARLPLADSIPAGDPRRGMKGFPRPGDNFSVDAANSGMNGDNFEYGSGPVFRMVIALGPDGVEGRNVLPGGQSGLTDSPFFDDQVALWLGNQTMPMRFAIDDVVAGATGRESFVPADLLP